jgi:hypothetical protein
LNYSVVNQIVIRKDSSELPAAPLPLFTSEFQSDLSVHMKEAGGLVKRFHEEKSTEMKYKMMKQSVNLSKSQ